jgi:peptidoglycan L-alanyl-D-glutamate endopeptidase CwlK
MPKYSARSLAQLATCHPSLRKVFEFVIGHLDHTVTEGWRNQLDQDKYFDEGKSRVRYPNGKHNKNPSVAVDATPYPVDYSNTKRVYYFAGFVMGVAAAMGIKMRWGGDWDGDFDFKDQTDLDDTPHFELVE